MTDCLIDIIRKYHHIHTKSSVTVHDFILMTSFLENGSCLKHEVIIVQELHV